MNNLKDCFQVKPYRDQSPPEQYAYILHRVSFTVCILGSYLLACALFTFSVIYFNWLLE